MPPPVIYIVVAVAMAGVGYALYQIFKSDDASTGSQDIGRRKEKKQKNERRLAKPHEASPSSSSGSTHEMRDLRQSATQSNLTADRRLPPSTGLRNRRSNTSARNAEDTAPSASGLMDGPSDKHIPITPLAPEPNPWSSVQGSRLQTTGPSHSPFEDHPEPASVPSRHEVIFDVAESAVGGTPRSSPALSPFELGSESPTLASLSPRSDSILLSESYASSAAAPQPAILSSASAQSPFDDDSGHATPRSASPELIDLHLSQSQAISSSRSSAPRLQLPTPSDSEVEVVSPTSPGTRAEHDWTAVSPEASQHAEFHSLSPSTSNLQFPSTLSPDVSAPPISRTTTDMSTSFFTAQSPATEFRSLPPTEPTSPFSESFTLSGDEDMYSIPSHTDSDESLPAFSMPEEERHRGDGLMFVVGSTAASHNSREDELGDSLSDRSGDGSSGGISDESWSEFSVPPTSPRH